MRAFSMCLYSLYVLSLSLLLSIVVVIVVGFGSLIRVSCQVSHKSNSFLSNSFNPQTLSSSSSSSDRRSCCCVAWWVFFCHRCCCHCSQFLVLSCTSELPHCLIACHWANPMVYAFARVFITILHCVTRNAVLFAAAYAIVLEERVRCKWNHSAAAAAAAAAIATIATKYEKNTRCTV